MGNIIAPSGASLHDAIVDGDAVAAVEVLQAHPDLTQRRLGVKKRTLYHFCAASGQVTVLKGICDHVWRTIPNESGAVALAGVQQSSKSQHPVIRRFINTSDQKGITPLSLACKKGHAQVVTFLLSQGADPWIKDAPKGRTALHHAARANHPECIEAVFSSPHVNQTGGPDAIPLKLVNLASTSGYTPLHYAAASHSYEAAAALLRHGADLCVRTWQVGFEFVQLDRGSTPVHAAARYQNLDVTILLLKHWDEHLRLHDVPDPRLVENVQRIKPYQLPGVKFNQALARILNPATAMADITGNAGVLISPGKRSAPAKTPQEGSGTCHPLTPLQRQDSELSRLSGSGSGAAAPGPGQTDPGADSHSNEPPAPPAPVHRQATPGAAYPAEVLTEPERLSGGNGGRPDLFAGQPSRRSRGLLDASPALPSPFAPRSRIAISSASHNSAFAIDAATNIEVPPLGVEYDAPPDPSATDAQLRSTAKRFSVPIPPTVPSTFSIPPPVPGSFSPRPTSLSMNVTSPTQQFSQSPPVARTRSTAVFPMPHLPITGGSNRTLPSSIAPSPSPASPPAVRQLLKSTSLQHTASSPSSLLLSSTVTSATKPLLAPSTASEGVNAWRCSEEWWGVGVPGGAPAQSLAPRRSAMSPQLGSGLGLAPENDEMFIQQQIPVSRQATLSRAQQQQPQQLQTGGPQQQPPPPPPPSVPQLHLPSSAASIRSHSTWDGDAYTPAAPPPPPPPLPQGRGDTAPLPGNATTTVMAWGSETAPSQEPGQAQAQGGSELHFSPSSPPLSLSSSLHAGRLLARKFSRKLSWAAAQATSSVAVRQDSIRACSPEHQNHQQPQISYASTGSTSTARHLGGGSNLAGSTQPPWAEAAAPPSTALIRTGTALDGRVGSASTWAAPPRPPTVRTAF